jgi:hypothetical protein
MTRFAQNGNVQTKLSRMVLRCIGDLGGEAMAAFLCARVIVRGAAPMPRHATLSHRWTARTVSWTGLSLLCYAVLVEASSAPVRGRTGSPQPGTRTHGRVRGFRSPTSGLLPLPLPRDG